MPSKVEPPPRLIFMNAVVRFILAFIWALGSAISSAFWIVNKIPNDADVLENSRPLPKDKLQNLKNAIPGNCFIRAHKRLYLALFDHERASVMALHQLKQNFLVVPLIPKTRPDTDGVSKGFSVASLTEIFKFDSEARTLGRQNPGCKLVFCTGADDPLVTRYPRTEALVMHTVPPLASGFKRNWFVTAAVGAVVHRCRSGRRCCWAATCS